MKTPDPGLTRSTQRSALEIMAPADIEPCTPNSCRREKVPSQWAWHYRTLTHLHDRVQQAHLEHASQAATPPVTEGDDIADTAQDRSDRDLLWAELGVENDK